MEHHHAVTKESNESTRSAFDVWCGGFVLVRPTDRVLLCVRQESGSGKPNADYIIHFQYVQFVSRQAKNCKRYTRGMERCAHNGIAEIEI